MKKLLIVCTFIISVTASRADENMTPAPMESSVFQASLTPDIAIHSKDTEIRGFAINVWGENPQHSFNFGIVNGSTGDSSGFSMAMFNYDDSYTGVQWGIVNYSKENFKGWQDGWINISKGTFKGFQHGIVNCAEEFHGFQLGWVNYSKNLNGVQIGLANIALNNGWFDEMPDKFAKGFPFVNWSF